MLIDLQNQKKTQTENVATKLQKSANKRKQRLTNSWKGLNTTRPQAAIQQLETQQKQSSDTRRNNSEISNININPENV